jgi:GT2 family glycosyltransferase
VPRLAIVIPVLGNLQGLEHTLVSVLENRPDSAQVFVVLNGPYEDPYHLGDEVTFVDAPEGAGLAVCANWGIRATRAAVVNLLTPGVEVGPGWADLALRHFAVPSVGSVAALVVRGAVTSRVVSAGIGYDAGGRVRRIGKGRPTNHPNLGGISPFGADTLAAFYRRSSLDLVGGFAEDLGDTVAGIDLALALQGAGYHCIFEPQCRAYAGPGSTDDYCFSQRGFDAELLFWRWAPVLGWTRSLSAHAARIMLECFQCLIQPGMVCHLAGRLRGSLTTGPRGRIRLGPGEFAPHGRPAARARCSSEADERDRRLVA